MAGFDLDAAGIVVSCASCGKKNRVRFAQLGKSAKCGQCGHALSAIAAPVEVPTADIFDAMTRESALPVIVDFWAPWCGPCRMVAPEFEKVARSNAGEYLVVKVNTDAVPELGERFGIRSIPTMAVFREGKEVTRTAGARPAAAIEEFVRGALNLASRA